MIHLVDLNRPHCYVSEVAHLSTTDGQSLVKHRPGDCLLTSWSRHRAHVAVVTAKVLCCRDNVTESNVWDHGDVALTQQEKQTENGI